MKFFKNINYNHIFKKIETPLKIFLINRLFLLIIIQVALICFPLSHNYPVEDSFPGKIFLNGLIRWDSGWYASISKDGYNINPISKQNNNLAFMPLYPLAVRYFSKTGFNELIGGVLLSNISLLFSVVLIYYLVNKHSGQKIAKNTILLFLYFPFSFYLSAMYAESFFLFLALLAFYFSEKKQWVIAIICAALSGLTREVGFVTAIAVFIFYLHTYNYSLSKINFKSLVFFVIGFVGSLSYAFYLTYRFGTPLVFLESHFTSGRITEYNLARITNNIRSMIDIRHLTGHLSAVLETFHLVLGITSLSLLFYSFKKIPYIYILWGIGTILISFTAWSVFGRLLTVIFPIYYALALLLTNKYIFKGYFLLSIFLLYVFTSMFALGYWVA